MAKIMKIPNGSLSKKRKSKDDGDSDGEYVLATDNQTSNNNKTLASQCSVRPPSQDTSQLSRSQQLETAGPRLRLAIDIGTTWTKATYQFYNSTAESVPTQVWPVAWESATFQTPSTLTYQKGKLLWGATLERQLNDGTISEATVMRQFKLALHADVRVKEVKDKVLALLKNENKTVSDLFADYMSALVKDAKHHIFHNNARGPAYDSKTIQVDIVISVPQCWAPGCNVALTDAAKKLGGSCRIVGEAMCAAAFMYTKEIDDPTAKRWLHVSICVLRSVLQRADIFGSLVTWS